jgi:hypothetical protein
VVAIEVGTNNSPRAAAATSVPTDQARKGRHYSSNEAKANVLADRFFPLLVRADLANIEGYRYLPELSIDQEVTTDEIICILKDISSDKAPGREVSLTASCESVEMSWLSL